jgi:hypothetical protein
MNPSHFPHKHESKSFSKTTGISDKSKPVPKDDGVKTNKAPVDDKWSALKAFRKANGLCFICGEKWGKGHKCPTQVSLNVIQEVMDIFEELSDDDDVDKEENTDHICIVAEPHLTKPSPAMQRRRKTLRFRGFIGKQELLILLDSGSAGTFITTELAQSLSQEVVSCEALHFTTADGSPLLSDTVIPELQFNIQGHTFTYDTRVLPLKGFDMILGADWLEDHSPMWAHWRKKLLRIPHKGQRITIQGIKDDIAQCTKLPAHKLKGLLKRKAIVHCVELLPVSLSEGSPVCSIVAMQQQSAKMQFSNEVPEKIQQVVQRFSNLFMDPTSLPPPREFDHHIPLVPGAQPVNVRPYKYNPHQKTEIEKQVAEML